MGMTIDEINEALYDIKTDAIYQITSKEKEAIDVAIDIMRKYQKIRKIAFPLQFCSTDKLEHEAIMKICEVIEDGKID